MNAHSDQILHRHFHLNNVCFNNREIMSKKMEENLNNYPEELEKMKELNKKAIQLGRDIRKQKELIRNIKTVKIFRKHISENIKKNKVIKKSKRKKSSNNVIRGDDASESNT